MPKVAFHVYRPEVLTSCVVFASPHSGRDYPWSFMRHTILNDHEIRTSEDAYVDRLFDSAQQFGAPFIKAGAPRAFVDLNRSAEELDPALIEGVRRVGHNPRVASGLGVIPRVVSNGRAIYRGKLPMIEAERRIALYWRPYHAQLKNLLDQSHKEFGTAILIDCHSMPHEAAAGAKRSNGTKPDIVIGDRNIRTLRHMPRLKRWLQLAGSWVVRQVSNTQVPDTTSGFRAYSKEAALRQTIVSEFSYTLESIIQAGKKRMAIAHVPVSTNESPRDSRLFNSVPSYITKSAATIVRIYTIYEPLKVFTTIGLVTFSVGFAISLRFLYYYLNGAGQGHLQSLILSAVLMIVGFQVLLIGLVADVISANRKLTEELLYRVRSSELTGGAGKPVGGSDERLRGEER